MSILKCSFILFGSKKMEINRKRKKEKMIISFCRLRVCATKSVLQKKDRVGFEVLTAVVMKMSART
jgi:hypothetical protein